jgi:hypothetical protein
MRRPHFRDIALWAIIGSVGVVVLGAALTGSFARAALLGSVLLGVVAGLGLMAVLSWIQVPRKGVAVAAGVAGLAVFLITWFRCRAASLDCMRALENAMLYIPLVVVLVGALVLYFTSRPLSSRAEE